MFTATCQNVECPQFGFVLPGLADSVAAGGVACYICGEPYTLTEMAGEPAGHASFNLATATTAPPTSNQIRLNTADQATVTKLFVSDFGADGLDLSTAFARLRTGWQLYLQDFDEAARWARYNVTGAPVDKTGYWEIPVTRQAAGTALLFQKVELQLIEP